MNDGGVAFPVSLRGWGHNGACGMSLRDYFAAKALQGLLANSALAYRDQWSLVAQAYSFADNMIHLRVQA